MKYITITAMAVVGTLNIGIAAAQPPGATTPMLKDETNYQGDRLKFPVRIDAVRKRGSTSVCIPAHTSLRALGDGKIKTGKTEEDAIRVILTRDLLSIPFSEVEDVGCETGVKDVRKDEVLLIPKSNLDGFGVERWGFTYGALVVPFKYHFEGSRSFEGNSTVGPYLGYRIANQRVGLSVKGIGFIGAAAIRVNRTDDNGNNDDETLAGFSYGLGLIGEVKGEFQLGIVFGQDRVSDGSDYEDNGKWWGAVALGFSFDN